MSEFRLSNRATVRLQEIYLFSEDRFGRYQAEAYLAGVKRSFELLAEFPRMGRSADDIAPGLRRFRYQSHHVIYSLESDHILIRGLPHVSQKLRPDLFE